MKDKLLYFLFAFFAFSISSSFAQSLVDLQATTVLTPSDGCVLGAHESISVQITNTGAVDVDTVYLYYQVDSGTVVSETLYDTIAAGSTYDHTFTSNSYDFSSAGSYYVAFWLSCPGDTLHANDTTNVTATLAGDLPITVTMNTGGYGYEVSWNIQDPNDSIVLQSQGSLNSYTTYTDEICLHSCQTYTFNMNDSYGDGWNGGTYTITTPNQIDTLPPVEVSAGGLTSGSSDSDDFSVCYNADASVIAIHTPSTGCLLGAHEPVVVEVSNNGGDTLFTWDISYSLDSGAVVTETVNDTLPPSGSHSYAFTTASENFSVTGNYNIVAWVTIANDVQSSNDTLSQHAYLSGTTPMTISTYSGPYAASGVGIAWEIIDANNNVILNSQEYGINNTTYLDSFCIVECEDYTINMTSAWSSWYGGNITISTMDSIPEIVASGTVTSYDATEDFRYCNGIDIALSDILIQDGCAKSDTENVVVEVSNVATDTIFGFEVSYNLDTLATVTETSSDTIAPGQSIQYTFGTTVDLSAMGIYNFTAWATTANDLSISNDTLSSEVDIFGDFELTLTTTTGNYGGEVSWVVINDNSGDTVAMTSPGAFSSYTTYENDICIITCEYFTIEMHDSWGDGWNGGTYSIDAPNPDSDTLPDINIISGTLSSGHSDSDAFIYCDGIDMGIVTSSLNGNGCVQSDSSFVSLTLKNFGSDSISGFNVSYILDGASTVTETVSDTVAPNEEYIHTFATVEDLSNSGGYQFEAWVVTAGDMVSNNDSITQDTVWLNGDVALVVATHIEYYYGDYGWAVTNANNDTIINSVTYGDNFTTYYSDEFCINACENYNFEMSVGSEWYDGWESAYYTILAPTGIDSIPYDTVHGGSLASGSYGVDIFSHCIGFDASMHGIPLSSTCTSFDDHITVQIENSGTDTIFTLEVNYLLDTAATSVTETINDTIAPGQIYDYTFSTIEDFSAEGNYQVVAWVSSLSDLNNANDSLATSFELSGTLPTTITLNTGGYPSEVSWLLIDANSDTVITSPSYSGTFTDFNTNFCIQECETYTIEMFDSYGDGWNSGHITFSSTEVDSTLSDTLFHATIENILPGLADTINSGTFFYCEEPDLAITHVNLESGCISSDHEEVVINLQNAGSLVDIQEFLVNYSLNGTTYSDSVDLEILTGGEASLTLANTFDLSNVGDHNLEISIQLTDDYNAANDSIIEVISLNTNVLPNLQSFDALADSIIDHFDNDAWTSNADTISDYVWRTHQGATPSYPYTGPSSGNGGSGTYLYVEQDNPGNIASITSRCYDLTSAVNPKLGFHYHKSGSDQGNLVVKAQGDTTIVLGTIVGQTQLPGNNPWLFQQYDLEMFIGQTIELIFEAHKTSGGSNGDICLDDVNVVDIPEFSMPDTLACGVDSIMISGPDNWSSYAWFSSDTTQIITADSQSVYLHTDADITLVAYDSLGFYENDTFNIQFVDELGIIPTSFDTTICIGGSLIIGDSIPNVESYVWSTGDSLVSLQVSLQTDSVFVLTVSNLCFSEDVDYNVSVSDPKATISASESAICEGDTAILTSAEFSAYQWTDASGVISTEQSVEVMDNGFYSLLITDEFSCQANETVEVSYLPADSCNDVNIVESELGDIEIYPNPNNGLFSIELNPSTELEKVTIFITNPVGEVVYQTYFNKLHASVKKDIDLTQMAQGVYIVNLRSNSVSETRKLTIYR